MQNVSTQSQDHSVQSATFTEKLQYYSKMIFGGSALTSLFSFMGAANKALTHAVVRSEWSPYLLWPLHDFQTKLYDSMEPYSLSPQTMLKIGLTSAAVSTGALVINRSLSDHSEPLPASKNITPTSSR